MDRVNMSVDKKPPDRTECDATFKLAKSIAHRTLGSREERVAIAKRALKDENLMLDADQLAEKLLADPLHQI